MPGWGDIMHELQNSAAQAGGLPDFDGIRRKYLAKLHDLTGRSTVIYASDFLNPLNVGPFASIGLMDMQGLMEAFHELPGPNLDLILHSPGGQAEATDRLVRYMRSKYSHVRVFVPLAAMSAATMWAMAADEIVMGKHSQLGPIDPQVTLPSGITVPGGALLEQFEEASEQCAENPAKVTGWLPTLQQYPPGLLKVCENAAKLAEELVAEWLQKYMFKGNPDTEVQAKSSAAWLADDSTHLSHGRAITRDQLRDRGLVVSDLEDDQALQDAVLSVHHATLQTFMGPAVKVIENHLGRAFVQQVGFVAPPGQMMGPPGQGMGGPSFPATPPTP